MRDDLTLGTSPDDVNFTHVRNDPRMMHDHLTGEDRLYMSSPESGFGSLGASTGHYFDKSSPIFDSMLSPPSEVPYLHQLGGHVDVRTVDQFLSKKASTPRIDKTIKYRNRMSRARIDLDDMVQAFKTMFNPSDGSAAGTIDTTEEHHESTLLLIFVAAGRITNDIFSRAHCTEVLSQIRKRIRPSFVAADKRTRRA